ncbi:Por secretion system C-terminal sorting domain-containing protein [Hymenobacter psychrotolerans DSM 18569]|uniref:Por secretion system C-terminal sorting domain-containing protein n=1 Tax=Hymenobacter psychrotolerans DSM 18569 TaxID=1121959 RepID=A0A1M7C0J0_9BACT|nr:Por secretion system C-terminal sorting domain-containing protein [Hymenobacter psychrotolerans DSM 18569]
MGARQPIYGTGTAESITDCNLVLLCTSVFRADRASNQNLDDFATLTLPLLSVGYLPAGVKVQMAQRVPKNSRAGFVVGSSSVLSAVGTVTITTFDGATPKETLNVTNLATTVLGSGAPGRLEFVAKQEFTHIQIVATSLLNVGYSIRVYYAYGIDANVVETAKGVVSRFGTPVEGQNYSTEVVDNGVSVCVNSGVQNPANAVSSSLNDYATFNSVVGVSCPNSLKVKLEGAVPGGYYAGFVVGKQGLADISLLGGLRITTYLNGEPRESVTSIDALNVTLLPNGQYQISFPTERAFDEVQITRSGLLSALDGLEIYYGFGLEPSAFEDQTPIRSDFSSGAGQVTTSGNGTVLNPQNAANSNLTDYAEIRTAAVGVLTTTAVNINLNGSGQAGDAAGVVLNANAGLLNTQLLNAIAIRTYDSNNNLLETASGGSLLSQGLLGNGSTEVYFNTTRDFQRVEVEISSTLSLFDRTQILYAFAETRPTGFPLTITNPGPLPVELAAFGAKAAGQAVEVAWRTASETNNSHFIVERATQVKSEFKAVGRVEGSGNSQGRSYTFRDETAASTGVATLYYRLQQVDTNGKTSYSPIAVVTLNPMKAEVLAVYPNPAASSTSITVELAPIMDSAAGVLRIYDVQGMLLRQLPVTQPTMRLQGEPLPAGLYNVILTGKQGQKLGSQRLVVTGR